MTTENIYEEIKDNTSKKKWRLGPLVDHRYMQYNKWGRIIDSSPFYLTYLLTRAYCNIHGKVVDLSMGTPLLPDQISR